MNIGIFGKNFIKKKMSTTAFNTVKNLYEKDIQRLISFCVRKYTFGFNLLIEERLDIYMNLSFQIL